MQGHQQIEHKNNRKNIYIYIYIYTWFIWNWGRKTSQFVLLCGFPQECPTWMLLLWEISTHNGQDHYKLMQTILWRITYASTVFTFFNISTLLLILYWYFLDLVFLKRFFPCCIYPHNNINCEVLKSHFCINCVRILFYSHVQPDNACLYVTWVGLHNIKMYNMKKQIAIRYKVKVNHATYQLHFKVRDVYKRVFIVYLHPHRDN